MDLPGSSNGLPGVVSSLAWTSVSTSPRTSFLSVDSTESANSKDDAGASVTRTDGNDPIEIWDVRRGYIAKWVVSGSAVEGGVTGTGVFVLQTLVASIPLLTDVDFGDSHALWAQHTSGMFSQLDLRYCMKPLDMITSTAVTWDVAGSLAFVTDRPKTWEAPYDDAYVPQKSSITDISLFILYRHPDVQASVLERHGLGKNLGDPPYKPTTQSVGTFAPMGSNNELEAFIKIAQGTLCRGSDKQAICLHNAEVHATCYWTRCFDLLRLQSPCHIDHRKYKSQFRATKRLSVIPAMHNETRRLTCVAVRIWSKLVFLRKYAAVVCNRNLTRMSTYKREIRFPQMFVRISHRCMLPGNEARANYQCVAHLALSETIRHMFGYLPERTCWSGRV